MTTPLLGTVCSLGIAMTNLHTKFEVSMFAQYEDMKGNEKCSNWSGLGLGHPWSPAMSPFVRAHMTFYLTLMETMRLSCTVFKLFVKSHLFLPTPPAFGDPLVVTCSNIIENFAIKKLESLGYRVALFPCSMFSCFDTMVACDRHRHTDRHTTTVYTMLT